jgi:glutamine phosphoribosylpyrophosphate amidotransferase
MAVADGRGLLVFKDMGLVSQVFDEATLATLHGHLAIGHTRHSTTGGSRWENALREAIREVRLVVVDPSIVRGNTTKAIVAMLREVGAREELPDPNPAWGRPGPTPSAATQPSTLPLPNP